EAVRIVALVGEAGQPALPVGREQAERIPALGTPGIGDLAALDHHVIDRAQRETPAHRQTGVAGANDNSGDLAHGTRVLPVRRPRRIRSSSLSRCRTPRIASATGPPAP